MNRFFVEVVVLDDLLPAGDRGFKQFAGVGAFRGRPPVTRVISVEEMDQTISKAVRIDRS